MLRASLDLDKLPSENVDQAQGIKIVQNALSVCFIAATAAHSLSHQLPLKTICNNAGVEGSIVAGKILENNNPNHGYDAYNDKYVDLIEAGIVDPLKVCQLY